MPRHLNKKNKCYERDNVFNEALASIEKVKQATNYEMQSLDEANAKIVALEEQITALETELYAVDLTADEAEKMKDALEELDKLRIKNDENEARIKDLEAENAEKDDDIEKIITNRDEVIAKYKDRIQKYKARLASNDGAVKNESAKQKPKLVFV